MEYGLNLFSIKSLLTSEKALTDVIIKLREMGYSFVQFSGMAFDGEMLKRVVKTTNTPIVLTHVPYELIVNETEKTVTDHLSFGCRNIGLGAPNVSMCKDEKSWKNFIDVLQKTAEKINGLGANFSYHNHHFEFLKFSDGETVFDYMIKNAPNVNFTLDSYWIQYGGCNPETFADKVKGRIECVHLKDYMIFGDHDKIWDFKNVFAPIGDGNLNFKTIIKKWKKDGAKYFLVEQDNASDFENPLEQVKRSIDYLKNLKV